MRSRRRCDVHRQRKWPGGDHLGRRDRSMEAPSEAVWVWTASREKWPTLPLEHRITFQNGAPVALDGEALDGSTLLEAMNRSFGAYGVGRAMYTGDTTIGLKGRIAFEAPGLTALIAAHRALSEALLSPAENDFLPLAAQRWVELAFHGRYHDALRPALRRASERCKRASMERSRCAAKARVSKRCASTLCISAEDRPSTLSGRLGVRSRLRASFDSWVKRCGPRLRSPKEAPGGDMKQSSDTLIAHLRELVRFDTQNPPRRVAESGVFSYLAEHLRVSSWIYKIMEKAV